MAKLNIAYLIKGVAFAALLMVGTLLGVILRETQVQGYLTLFLVFLVNTAAVVTVYILMKREFDAKDTKKPVEKTGKKEKSAKKTIEKVEEPESKDSTEEKDKFMTEADKTPSDSPSTQ